MNKEEIKLVGKVMAVELYKMENVDVITTEEAMMLLGYKSKKTLYNNKIPHNQFGWSKKAILDLLNK